MTSEGPTRTWTWLDPIRRPSLRFTIATLFTLLLLAVTFTILVYTYTSNARSILDVAKSLLHENREAVIVKTGQHLRPAALTAQLNAAWAERGVIDLDDRERFKRLCAGFLRAYPQLREVNFGTEQGSIFGAERRDEGVVNLYQIERGSAHDPTAHLRYEFVDAEGKPAGTKEEESEYDPRVRPWYVGAARRKGTFWTEPYVFMTDKAQAGVTAAHAVRDAEGKRIGVMSCDVELEDLSRFLQGLRVGKTGFGMLVNRENKVVCHPDMERAVVREGEAIRPRAVREMGLPWLSEAVKRAPAGEGFMERVRPNGGGVRIVSVHPLPPELGLDWKIVLAVPEDDFVGELKWTNRVVMFFAAAIILVAVLAIAAVSRRISKPLEVLTLEAEKIRELDLEGDIEIQSHVVEIERISRAMARLKTAMRAFEKYVPATLVKKLIRTGEEARLGGRVETLTIFFSDIESFTTISESAPPQMLMLHLSEYLDELTKIILSCGGTVDKYIGDGIMAFWGAPLADEKHAEHAVRAAILCRRKLKVLNARWAEEGKPLLHTRIGIHTGETVVGNLGSSERMNYSLLGDSVNLAARLEGVNKVYGTSVLISETTFSQLGDGFVTRPIDYVVVKGKSRRVKVFEVLDLKDDEADPDRVALAERCTEAFALYREREWKKCVALLEKTRETHPDDVPSGRLLERCKDFIDNPPEERTWCEHIDWK